MGNIGTERYSKELHQSELVLYQALADTFYSVLENDQSLNKRYVEGRVRAMKLNSEGTPMFQLSYDEINERIGWLQLNLPRSNQKLLHIQTRLQDPDWGKVADSTKWNGNNLQNGHIQADVTPVGLAVAQVLGSDPQNPGVESTLVHFTKLIREPGRWVSPHER